jgi:6-phosphogluconolactonase
MKRRTFLAGASALIGASHMPKAWAAAPSRYLLYVGHRLDAKGDPKLEGISSCWFDAAAGTCSAVTQVSDLPAATAFTLSANAKHLYSVNEGGNDGKSDGGLVAFEVDHRSGKLKMLNQVGSNGGGPTSLKLDGTGKVAIVACFGAGRTNAFRVNPDGTLGEMTATMQHAGTGPHPRQKSPHAHGIAVSPDNRYVYSADLGADRVFIFKFDAAKGSLTPNETPFFQTSAGMGPRQMVFHPSGKFLYLLTELIPRVLVFAVGKEGSLTLIDTTSLSPDDPKADLSAAGIVIRRDGKFLYTTTRADSSVEMFTVDQATGKLTAGARLHTGGKSPWSSAIDPTGRYLLTTDIESNALSVFQLDAASGTPKLLGAGPSVPVPASSIFVPL